MEGPTHDMTRSRILVVDDSPSVRGLLVTVLRERGYETETAVDGEAALLACSARPPDLILLDVTMPGMDGYETCRRLKTDPSLADIPVVFMSAFAETLDQVRAFALGAVDFVTKPFKAEELHARISTHLRMRDLHHSLLVRTEELERSLARSGELERSRDALVHMVVHDLRAPLAALHLCLDGVRTLGVDLLPPGLVRSVDSALTATASLEHMVDTMLAVSRLESGRLAVAPERHDVVALTRTVTERLAPLARDRNVAMEGPPSPVHALCDRALVSRVVQNLLDNALKFTPRGGTILIRVTTDDAIARVAVSDTGPGIPREWQGRIFEKFAAVDVKRSSGDTRSPVGLGLAFCKLAVEAHGGTIGVESDGATGTTLWFTLPRDGPPKA